MRRGALIAYLLVMCLLAVCSRAPVAHASARVEALVGPDGVAVKIVLSNVTASLYELMKSHPEAFNETTVPRAMVKYVEAMKFGEAHYSRTDIEFDDATRTVVLSFTLAGDGVLSFHYNKTTMARIYKLNAAWRKADVSVKSDNKVLLKLNFSSYFGAPLEKWELVDYDLGGGDVRKALYMNSTAEDRLDPVWYFILPKDAKFLEAKGDTLTFESPPRPTDLFMASPFWPFLIVVAVTGLAVIYRKASVRLVAPGGGGRGA